MKRFYAYIFEQVQGPLSPEEIKKLSGFGRGTMVFSEDLVNGTPDDWKPAYQVPEFGKIPFSQLKPPNFSPSDAAQSQRGQESAPSDATDNAAGQTGLTDTERMRLLEHVHLLENELVTLRKQSQEFENQKSQIRDKEQKFYDLAQEFRAYKEGHPPAPSVPDSAKETQGLTDDDEYSQLDVPFGKILLIGIGSLVIGSGAWSLVPDSPANRFVKRLWSSVRGAEAGSKKDGEKPSVTDQTQPKNAVTLSQKTPKPAKPLKAAAKKPALSGKEVLEKKILDQYRKKVLAAKKNDEFASKGIGPMSPDYLYLVEAERDVNLEEKNYKRLVETYKRTYGQAEWDGFIKRVRARRRK